MVAVIIFAIPIAFMVHSTDAQNHNLGREAYLAKQAIDFDHDLAHPKSFILYLIAALMVNCLCFALYEFFSFCIRKILEKVNAND